MRRSAVLACCAALILLCAGCAGARRHPESAVGQKDLIDLGLDAPMR